MRAGKIVRKNAVECADQRQLVRALLTDYGVAEDYGKDDGFQHGFQVPGFQVFRFQVVRFQSFNQLET